MNPDDLFELTFFFTFFLDCMSDASDKTYTSLDVHRLPLLDHVHWQYLTEIMCKTR